MPRLIEPRTLKGFRDYPPELALPRERLMEQARRVFRSYGFAPIDTPALEYAEILLGKLDPNAEIQRQLYRFRDHGGRDVALRFDLTVPLARFAAQHVGPNPGQIPAPFKRYHIGPVWRGENPQAGRFREFVQCDFDTIGTRAAAADIEIALVIQDLLSDLGFERFEIRVNHRQILGGILAAFGAAERATPVLTALDKLAKQGRDAVLDELSRAGLAAQSAEDLVRSVETRGSNDEILRFVAERFGQPAETQEALARLRELFAVAAAIGLPAERLRLDLATCRGLDYYTGIVFETVLTDLPAIGSVCSGGRYDDLAGLYTKQSLPGVGASLGLDRLLAAMEALDLLPASSAPAPVLIVQFEAQRLAEYHRLARAIRAVGIGAEVYPECRKIGAQLSYAERKGCRAAVIAGPDELAAGTCKLKDLTARSEHVVSQPELPAAVIALLARESA